MALTHSKPIRRPHRAVVQQKDTAPILDASTVAERVAHQVRSLGALETVYVKVKPWGFECWLVADHSTEEERFRLYDLEWQLMERTPDVGFKFHLVDRQGEPLTKVVTLEPLHHQFYSLSE